PRGENWRVPSARPSRRSATRTPSRWSRCSPARRPRPSRPSATSRRDCAPNSPPRRPSGTAAPGDGEVGGASLADVLVPEDDAPVPAARIRAVLASIATDGELFSSAAVIGPDGRYSHGVTARAHHKDHAEYIGATARARRRAARIAECEGRIAALDELLAAADR